MEGKEGGGEEEVEGASGQDWGIREEGGPRGPSRSARPTGD